MVTGLRLQDLTHNDIQNYVTAKLGQNERMKALCISEPIHVPELIEELFDRRFSTIKQDVADTRNVVFDSLFDGSLPVLELAFALQRYHHLAETAGVGFCTPNQITSICTEMETRLKTRCRGLLEIRHNTSDTQPDPGSLLEVHHNTSDTQLNPSSHIEYLHLTVRDFLIKPKTQKAQLEHAKRIQSSCRVAEIIYPAIQSSLRRQPEIRD